MKAIVYRFVLLLVAALASGPALAQQRSGEVLDAFLAVSAGGVAATEVEDASDG